MKAAEDETEPLHMGCLNPCRAPGSEEFGQALVIEAPYHAVNCNLERIDYQPKVAREVEFLF